MGLLDRLVEVCVTASGEGRGKGEGGFCMWKVVDEKEEEKSWKRMLKVASKTPKGCPVSTLRIARAELRRTLVRAVEALDNVEIRWDSTITSISPGADDKVEVKLSTAQRDTADMFIAADGSSSKIRTLLRPSDILHFAGPTCITGRSPIKDLHPSSSSSDFGTVISGRGLALFLAPVDHEKMVWCLSWHVDSPPLPRKQPLSSQDSAALLDEARKQGSNVFGARFARIVDATDEATVTQFNALDKPAFPHSPGYIQTPALCALEKKVFFLGDANHAVSPFAGNGANLALMDGWALAESLLHGPVPAAATSNKAFEDYLGEVIKKYDAMAVGRAKKVVSISHFSIRVMHSSGWWSSFWFVVLKVVQWLLFRKVE